MRRILVGVVLAVVLSGRLEAQSLVSVTLDIFYIGASSPFMSTTFVYTSTACNQPAPTTTGTVINPTRVIFDDPVNIGRFCVFAQPTFLGAVPIPGSYTATVTVTDDLGRVSGRSAASPPFQRLAPLAAPTGLKLIP